MAANLLGGPSRGVGAGKSKTDAYRKNGNTVECPRCFASRVELDPLTNQRRCKCPKSKHQVQGLVGITRFEMPHKPKIGTCMKGATRSWCKRMMNKLQPTSSVPRVTLLPKWTVCVCKRIKNPFRKALSTPTHTELQSGITSMVVAIDMHPKNLEEEWNPVFK